VRKGPLDGRPPWRGADLGFAESTRTSLLLLRGRVEAPLGQQIAARLGCDLPTTPIALAQGDRAKVLMLAPCRWMLFADREASPMLLAQLRETLAGSFVAVSDVSDGYAQVRLEGRRAIDLLATGTAVDLHPRIFAVGQAVQTELARTRCLIRRDEEVAYELLVDVSAADYVWTWLTTNAALTIAAHQLTARHSKDASSSRRS
jgi:sarcosine oxidase subunit gamma